MNQQMWDDGHDLPETDEYVACEECNRSVTTYTFHHNSGLCDDCADTYTYNKHEEDYDDDCA